MIAGVIHFRHLTVKLYLKFVRSQCRYNAMGKYALCQLGVCIMPAPRIYLEWAQIVYYANYLPASILDPDNTWLPIVEVKMPRRGQACQGLCLTVVCMLGNGMYITERQIL